MSSAETLLWRRNLHVVTAAVFVVYTGFAFVIPFLPLYVRELGVGERDAVLWAGVLIGIAPLLAGLAAPFWGRLADHYGARPMALVALGSYAVLMAATPLCVTPWQFLIARATLGLCGGIGPLGLAMATAGAPPGETGRGVGAVQAAQILSAAAGPLAGGLLAEALGMRVTFLAAATLCATAFVLVLVLYRDQNARTAKRASWKEALSLPGLAPVLAALFLVNFIGRSFTPVLPAYLATLGVPAVRLPSAAGLLVSAYSVAAALSATGLGRASRKVAPKRLLVGTLVGGALTVVPMAVVGSYGPFLALAVTLGLAAGGSLTLCYTLGGLLVPEGRRATVFGLLSMAALVGGSVSPSAAGLLARVDLRAIFWADAALYALLALAVAIVPLGELRSHAAPARS